MSEIINLRTERKRKRRELDEKQAEENRISHGAPKHLKTLQKATLKAENAKIEAHKLQPKSAKTPLNKSDEN